MAFPMVDKRMRLLGFERVELAARASRTVTITADPRLLAKFDERASRWRIAAGAHAVAVGESANDFVLTGSARLAGRLFGKLFLGPRAPSPRHPIGNLGHLKSNEGWNLALQV